MKKYDSLLNKTELFHRLAMYGERNSFLQALSQNQSDLNKLTVTVQQFINDIKNRWDQVKFNTNITMPFIRLQSLLNHAKDTNDLRSIQQIPTLMDQLLNAVQSENVMPEAIDALHQLRESAGVSINQISNANSINGEGATAPAKETSQNRYNRLVQKYQEMNVPGKSLAPNYGDMKTVQLLQTFLASSLGIDTLGPKGIDGKMGPDTIAALRQWAKANGVTTQDVEQLMQIALSKANYEQKVKI